MNWLVSIAGLGLIVALVVGVGSILKEVLGPGAYPAVFGSIWLISALFHGKKA